MPNSHLAWRWVYGALILPISPFSCGLRAEAEGGCEIFMDSWAQRPLRFYLAGSYTNLKKIISLLPVDICHRWHCIIPSLGTWCGGRSLKSSMADAWSLHISHSPAGLRTGSVRFSCRGCGECMATALRLHIFRTISAQPL